MEVTVSPRSMAQVAAVLAFVISHMTFLAAQDDETGRCPKAVYQSLRSLFQHGSAGFYDLRALQRSDGSAGGRLQHRDDESRLLLHRSQSEILLYYENIS